MLICIWGINTKAQKKELIEIADSLSVQDSIIVASESLGRKVFPRKATIYSAVVPGLGQIYNKQWWKVPFIYGGFIGFGLVINYNHQYYLKSFRGYKEFEDGDPNTTFYNELLLHDVDEFTDTGALNILEKAIDKYSHDRNLFVIITAGFYLFNILDANVSAHLIDFDISEDLTFNFEPIATDPLTNTPIMGATLSYNF